MRDVERIDNFCNKLKEYWKKVPDWRFGQLIMNVLGTCQKDPFFYEEDEMLKIFKNYFEKGEK